MLLLDQAGWHISPKLRVPDTIMLLPLPPRAPQPNPMETVWPFVRDTWPSNLIFPSHGEIVDHGRDARNRLVGRTWRIMFLGLRDRAHGF